MQYNWRKRIMNKKQMYIFISTCIAVLLISSCVPGILSTSQTTKAVPSELQKNNSSDDARITSYVNGIPQTQILSYESGAYLKELFAQLVKANAQDPCSPETLDLQRRILQYAEVNNLLPSGTTADEMFTQFSTRSQQLAARYIGKPLGLDMTGVGHEMFCNFVSTGEGGAFPIIILPRFIPIIMGPLPRLFVGWATDSGFTSCGGLISGTGFYAGGQQRGFALGFWGIGFSIFLPPVRAYGMFGYAVYAKTTAEHMEFYPPNNPPEITQTDPVDGQEMVPVSTSELRFSIEDKDQDLMSYNVTTYPDIGSGSAGLKPNGVYSIQLSGLDSLKTYTCYIQVNDGKDTIEKTISFTTEQATPLILNPAPFDNERDVPMNLPQLQFTLKDYQGDSMEYTVQTSPDIGSGHNTGVHDGTFTVPISGMVYGGEYHWFVNVTDGTNWARKMYSFTTGYPSPFDPFDYGWQYRKQIIIDHTQIVGDLLNFPVLLITTDSDLIKAQADGDDILFMNNAGEAIKLPHELEAFNQGNGALQAWVNIPLLSAHEDTVFYVYYGNPTCSIQQNAEKTWDAEFWGVWHLKESSGIRYDSTRYGRDSISLGTMHTTSAKIGGGEIFNDRSDNISTIVNADKMSQLTMECWVAFSTEEADPSTGGDVFMNFYKNDPSVFRDDDEKFYVWVDGYTEEIESTHVFRDTNWHYVTVVATGSELLLYVDNVLEGSAPFAGASSDLYPFYMGDNRKGTDYFFGTMDEVRISSCARDINWIAACYQNQNDPSGFVTFGSEEPHP